MSAERLREAADEIHHDAGLMNDADNAFMHAIADWLEEAADHLEVGEESDALPSHICPTALEGLECSVLGQALKVANAYLGTNGDPA